MSRRNAFLAVHGLALAYTAAGVVVVVASSSVRFVWPGLLLLVFAGTSMAGGFFYRLGVEDRARAARTLAAYRSASRRARDATDALVEADDERDALRAALADAHLTIAQLRGEA